MLIALLSLVAGFLSVLAPCVLPLLPVIIGGSVTGKENKWRPYIITGSLVFSLILFTLLLKVSTSLIGIDPRVWNYLSGGIVISLGLVLLFPNKWDMVIGKLGIQAKSQKLLGNAGNKKNGAVSSVLTGLALGPVFSSCSPMYAWVIATVLPQDTSRGLLYLAMYSVGLAAALLGISLLGRRMTDKIKWLSDPTGKFQKIIAVLFILVGLAVATGYDKTIQTYLLDKDFLNIKSLEIKLVPDDKPGEQNSTPSSSPKSNPLFNVLPYKAPELTGLQEWINSDPLSLNVLQGKVVLIDFWTYSCINCERTLPYIQGWYDSYKDDGFVVIGVHAPEFTFEKVPKNVRRAVSDRKLTYPVALDNNFSTWRAYKNQFWPATYLIDKDGQVRRTHFGEGEYNKTEEAIRLLLEEMGATDLKKSQINYSDTPISSGQTPETYINAERAERVTNSLFKREHTYQVTENQPTHTWSLGGTWNVGSESSVCVSDCTLQITYKARTMYAVFSGTGIVTVKGKTTIADNDDIYTLISNDKVVEETVTLQLTPGLSIHAFTFGS